MRQITFSLMGKSYQVAYPTVGKLTAIEATKQALTGGQYGNMLRTETLAAQAALDIVDIQATLSILAPDVIKDLEASSFSELGIQDFNTIRDAYRSQIVPWLKEVGGVLSNPNG